MNGIRFKLDTVLALLGMAFGFAVFAFYILRIRRLGAVLFFVIGLSCLTYLLLLRKRESRANVLGLSRPFSPKSIVTVDLIFIALLACSIFSIYGLYTNPLAYFLFIWAAILLTIIEIVLFTPTTKMCVDVLLKVLAISAALRWVPYLSFPGIIGDDPWWHTLFINQISESARIPPGVVYSSFPLFHLETVMLSSISSMSSLKFVQLISVSLFEVVSLIAVFSIVNYVLGPRLGLMAALIVGASDWQIQWGVFLIPMSMGLVFFTFVLFLILHGTNKHQVIAVVLLLATIIMTHTISSFILLLTLASVLVAQKLYRPLFGKKPRLLVGFPLVMFYAIALFGYWMYASSFFTIQILGFDRTIAGLSTTTYTPPLPLSPFLEYWSTEQLNYEVNNAGMYLLYWLSILGILLWLSGQRDESTPFYLISAGIVLFAVSYGSLSLNVGQIVPERWLAFIYVLLSAPAIKGIQALSGLFKNKTAGFVFATTIVLAMSILMTADTTANLGNAPLLKGPRFALSTSEIYAANVLDTRYPRNIFTDSYYILPFMYGDHGGGKVSSLELLSGTGELLRSGLIAIRKSSYSSPVGVIIANKEVLVTLTEKLRNDLDSSKGRILDNGAVTAWLP